MTTREERLRVSILGAKEGARDLDRLERATDGLGDEFRDLARTAKVLDGRLDGLRASQRELASEFAKTGDAEVGKKLKAVTADIATATAARKALVGDIEAALDEADRNAEKRSKEARHRAEKDAKEESKRRAAALREAQQHFRQMAEASKRANEQIQRNLRRLGGRALGFGRGAANVGAAGAAGASFAGPAVSGLVAAGKGVAAIGKAMASLLPLAATLPSLLAGFVLVTSTVKMAGPAMGKALMPVADAFKGIQGRIGALASDGLPRLAREFVRVNFPAIRRAMEEIADDLNTVVVVTGKWINSAAGQETIRKLTVATADATERLDGRLARVAIAFGNMVNRIGGRAIAGAARAMEQLSEATIRWLDSIDNDDIDKALKNLSAWGGKAKETFLVLRDIGQWMSENEDKVKRFSDAVATAGIVMGVATGNWLAVLVAGASLAINHWDELKKKAGELGPVLKDTWNNIKNDPGLQGIWGSMKKAWQGAVDSFKKGTEDIGPKVTKMFEEWKKAWDEWAPLIKAWWDGVGKPVFSGLGTIVADNLEIFIDFMTRSAKALDLLGEAIKFLWRVASEYFGYIIGAAAAAFGWVPGIGPKLEKAAKDFESFKNRVNAALDGIEDEVVNITYRTQGRAVQGSSVFQSGIGGHAAGTPSAAAGLAWVGERGPELVNFRGGERVYDARTSARMASGQPTLRVIGDANSWLYQAIQYGLRTGQLRLS